MKKMLKLIILVICLIGITGCGSKSLHYDKEVDDSFTKYTNDFAISMYEDSPMDINFCFVNPKEFGLEAQKYDGLTYEKTDVSALKEEKKKVKEYDYYALSLKNRLVYDTLIDFINKKIDMADYYYLETGLGSYLGYQANLPLYLSLYRFDSIADVENYFTYLENTLDDFKEIMRFETSKIEKKTSLPDSTLKAVIDQCEKVYEDENFYLKSIFADKIKDLDTDEDLISKNNELVEEFQEAYKYLATSIEENLLGKQKKSGALCEYNGGKDYYTLLVQEATGTNKSIPQIKKEIEEAITSETTKFYEYYVKWYSQYSLTHSDVDMTDFNLERFTSLTSYEEIINSYYNNKSLWTIFPKLEEGLDFEIEIIDEALEDNFSPAAYLNSPLDGNAINKIMINEGYLEKMGTDIAIYNYLYTTLAHEGIPGHMYYDNYYKQSTNYNYLVKTIGCTGTAEGWAVYVESIVPLLSEASKSYNNMMISYTLLNGYLQAYIDILIHYYGWDLTKIASYLGISDTDAQPIFDQLVETPGNSLEYYYGYLQLKQTKQNVEKKLGNDYTDLIFNTFILDMGPIPYHIINKHLDEVYNYLPKTA